MHIFAQADPADRPPLALSSKSLLAVSQLHKLEIPDPMAHRAPCNVDPEWLFNELAYVYPKCGCGGLERLLRQIRPKMPNGQPDRSLQLCVDCMKYLPRCKAYWLAQAQELGNETWDTEDQEEWDHARKFFSTGIKVQCPRCRLGEYSLIDVRPSSNREGQDNNTSELS